MEKAIIDVENNFKFKFKGKQKQAVKSILGGKDTFVILPTGYGKSAIYFFLPLLFSLITGQESCILVISPLIALMQDQIRKLSEREISATLVGESQSCKGVADEIAKGIYQIVFSSPEAVLKSGVWRQSITYGEFNKRLRTVVIDEAHCITEWGGEFRQEYACLSDLRSVFHEDTPFLALTATATNKMLNDIMSHLNMVKGRTEVVSLLPDRQNIAYNVLKSQKHVSELNWILNDIQENGNKSKKYIIYCRNILSCALLFEFFFLGLGECTADLTNRRIAMFHRSTAEENKCHVMEEFPKHESKIRVVFATIAFGMGIDIPDVDVVIHWGAPRGLEQFAQESGRAGRDKRDALSLIYFTGRDIAKGRCKEGVASFCKPTQCMRTILNKYFELTLDCIKEDERTSHNVMERSKCKCCSFCKKDCNCGNCSNIFTTVLSSISGPDEMDADIQRTLTDYQLLKIQENLLDFQKDIIEKFGSSSFLDENCINEIMLNCHYVFCKEDIASLGIIDEIAEEVFCLIDEVS